MIYRRYSRLLFSFSVSIALIALALDPEYDRQHQHHDAEYPRADTDIRRPAERAVLPLPDHHLFGGLIKGLVIVVPLAEIAFDIVRNGHDCTFDLNGSFRQKERHSWSRFSEVFRTNWKAGIIPSILFLLCFAALLKGMIALWNGAVAGTVSWLLFSGAAFIAVVIVGILSVLFPMLSRFENSLGALLKNTVMLSLSHLPRAIALGVINSVSLFLCVRLVVPLFFLPGLAALISSLFIEPMFKPYMGEEK